jgi:hypothetical protein
MEDVGARDAFGRGLVTGTRNEAAADGGGRTKPWPGRGGAERALILGGFKRGGLAGLDSRSGGGIAFCKLSRCISSKVLWLIGARGLLTASETTIEGGGRISMPDCGEGEVTRLEFGVR